MSRWWWSTQRHGSQSNQTPLVNTAQLWSPPPILPSPSRAAARGPSAIGSHRMADGRRPLAPAYSQQLHTGAVLAGSALASRRCAPRRGAVWSVARRPPHVCPASASASTACGYSSTQDLEYYIPGSGTIVLYSTRTKVSPRAVAASAATSTRRRWRSPTAWSSPRLRPRRRSRSMPSA